MPKDAKQFALELAVEQALRALFSPRLFANQNNPHDQPSRLADLRDAQHTIDKLHPTDDQLADAVLRIFRRNMIIALGTRTPVTE